MSDHDLLIFRNAKNAKNKRIFCISNRKYYLNITTAAKELNLSVSEISKQLHGQRKHVRGYVFAYAPENFSVEEINQMREDLRRAIAEDEL